MNHVIKRIKALPPGVKASIAFFIANIITTGIAYITTPLFTRLLTTEEYGVVSVYLTWKQLLGIVAMFCLSYGVFNNGMSDYPTNRNEYSFSMLLLSNTITILFSCVLIIIYPFAKTIIGLNYNVLFLLIVIYLLQPAYTFWIVRQRYELKYKWTVTWTIVCAFISPIIAIICIVLLPEKRLDARIFGSEIPLVIVYLGFYIYLARQAKFRVQKNYWKEAILFNLPLIPHYLSTYLLSSSDRIMIAKLVDNQATAYYSLAYSVASVAIIVWTAINASLVPFTYEKCKEKDYKKISDVTLPILCLFAIVCVFVIMLAPELISVMATSNYLEAIYVIPPVVGGVFFQVHYYIYANVLYYYKNPKYVMVASVLATIFNVLLNYIFIPKFGYQAAGYTTFVCYLVQAIIDYFAMKKVVGVSVYNMKLIGLLSCAIAFVSLLGRLLYMFTIFRYLIIALIIVILVVFRKIIIKAIMTIRK